MKVFHFILIATSLIALSHCVFKSEFDLKHPVYEGKSLEQQIMDSDLSNKFFQNVDENVDMCEKRQNPLEPNYFYFLPVFKAKLYQVGDSVEFTAGCFQKNVATLKELSTDKMVISLETSEPKSVLCQDLYVVHTTSINHITAVFYKGTHEITIKNLSQDDLDEIKVNSVKILGFCQGLLASLKSLFISLEMFVGGMGYNPDHVIPLFRPHIPEYMIENNLKMLDLYNHWHPLSRNDTVIDLDESEIHTGDFVAISRIDGVDPIIMIGTGSHIGHSCVCAWIDGELYVIESQDGWYWPYHGIQRNKFKEWVRLAHIAEFNVAILPLREDIRSKFDEKKAIEWFKSVEGLNYGYHNFLFSWIDTKDSNLPFSLAHEHFEFLFSVLEKISAPLAAKMMGEALNMRVGTRNLTISQATAEGARQGKTFEELVAMPEIDGWIYSDGPNYVCSCFVTAFYKAGGLFDGLSIQANEFTPKDVYSLNFFDKNYKRPQACIDADPELPYCQIMGKFKVDLPTYSSIDPYDHMNENCPSLGPDFVRPADC